MKRHAAKNRICHVVHSKALTLGLLALVAGQATANPVGGQVVQGAASIQGSGSTLTVNQLSQRAIVNWQGFSIGAGETTRFNLPSSASAIMNRVVTNNPSAIYGNLSSNGQVFLINPSGIIVGPTGVINTSGFVASTRDVSNQNFMNGGGLDFQGDSQGAVKNLGRIVANNGDAVLIGARAENAGTMDAALGVAALVAGNSVYYVPDSAGSILVKSGVTLADGETAVNNSGLISAAQAELHGTGGNVLALAINNTGIVSATQVGIIGGRVILSGGDGKTEISGTVSASAGSAGGEIHVLGQEVAVKSGALLDASGTTGGGQILVGGDYQGKNPSVQNAQNTAIEAGAQLRADALDTGNGGRVIVWADGTTLYGGAISARGGANGGNGGFVEVSGKRALAFRGTADLRAPQGGTGNLLLDPTDITIGVIAPNTVSCAAGTCSGSGASSYFDANVLETLLNSSNVTVTTSSGGGGAGDITLDSSMAQLSSLMASNNLTLDAEHDILVNGALYLIPSLPTGNGTPTLTLLAGRDITVAPNLNNSNALIKPFALIGDQGLTLVAGRTDSTGTINIGANSGIGTISELSNGFETGGPIRVFGVSADQTTLTGWSGASAAVVTAGKSYGDAGTAAAGIYYQAAAPAPDPDPAVTPGTSQPTVITVIPLEQASSITVNPLYGFGSDLEQIFASMKEEVRVSGGRVYFGSDVDQLLTVTRWIADASTPPGTRKSDNYAAVLVALMQGIEQTPSGERTASDNLIYKRLQAVVSGALPKFLDYHPEEFLLIPKIKASEQRLSELKRARASITGEGAALPNLMIMANAGSDSVMGLESDIAAEEQKLASMKQQYESVVTPQALLSFYLEFYTIYEYT